jgi:hypothetical protein
VELILETNAQLPNANDLLPLKVWEGLHPSCLTADEISRQCERRAQRRSGPGGQHRNKTSSGVFLLHAPTGVVAEATERRSQAENSKIALARMQLKLAVEIRTMSPIVGCIDSEEQGIRRHLQARAMRVARRSPDYPALCALLLNDFYFTGGQPSLVGQFWKTGSSGLVRFLKTHPPAIVFVNTIREHHGRLQLR